MLQSKAILKKQRLFKHSFYGSRKKISRYTMLIFLLMILSSCNKDMLSIYSDYLTLENLSSYYIDTPDPKLNHPPFGQRLIIRWNIPKEAFLIDSTRLEITIRYRDRSQETKTINIKKSFGSYILCITGNQYCDRGGILSYKAILWNGDCILEEWRHQLWAELILFEEVCEDSIDETEESSDASEVEDIEFVP